MRNGRETPLGVAVKGLLAGMGGAAALTLMVGAGRKLMSGGEQPDRAPDSEGISAGQALSEGPGMPPDMNRVTATFVQKLATGIFGTSLSSREQYLAGTAWHLAYGGFWGMIYGLVRESVEVPKLLLGSLQGVLVWAFGFAWLVPKMGLVLRPGEQRPRTTGIVVGVHVAYGTVVAFLYGRLSERDRKARG